MKSGVPLDGRTDTCTSGAGTLLMEFGILSRLLGDPVYEMAARRANKVLWLLRHNKTGLLGKLLNNIFNSSTLNFFELSLILNKK